MKATHGDSKDKKIFTPGGVGDFSKSPNARVISYFGWLASKSGPHTSGPYSYCYQYNNSNTCISGYKYSYIYNSDTRSAAQPFTGVAKASQVAIYAEQYSGSGGGTISIYKDNSGAPGTLVAGATGTFTSPPAFLGNFSAGELQTVTFPKVKLNKANQYWVVVSGGSTNGAVAWDAQDSNFTTDAAYTMGEDFNDQYSYTFHEHYFTAGGYNYTYNTPYSGGSGGWIVTAAGFYGDPSGAFSVN